MKRFIWLITFVMNVVFVIFIISLSSCSLSSPSLEPTISPVPTTVRQVRQSYIVERGDVVNQVNISGRIVPVTQSDLFFKNNGRIRQIYFRKNDIVNKGDVLADLEGVETIQRNMQIREINLERARIHVENAKLALDLFRNTTSPDSSGYQEMLQTKINEVTLAELAVKETTLSLGESMQAITDSLLISPIDGIVLDLFIQQGSPVEAYQAIGNVANLEELEVGIQAFPDDLENVEVGTEVIVTPRNDDSRNYAGLIRQISIRRLGEGMAGDQMRIMLKMHPSEAGFELGDLVEVALILEKSKDTLWLHPSAIRRFEGRTFVVVQDGEIQRRTDVRTGVSSDDRVEILSGLEEGQIVIGQ